MTIGVNVFFGRCVAVRVGNGVGVADGDGTCVGVAGATVDEVEVERAIAIGAIVTEGAASNGELQADNRPTSKNSITRILGTTHLATGQETKAIVGRNATYCPLPGGRLAYVCPTFCNQRVFQIA